MVSCLPIPSLLSLPHVPAVSPRAALGNLVPGPCRMHTCAFSIPGGTRHLVLGGTRAGDNALFKPSVSPSGPQGCRILPVGFQLLSALRVCPLCFLPSGRANHPSLCLFLTPPLARTRTLRALGHHRGTLTLVFLVQTSLLEEGPSS